jgi:hypothetical protein
MSVVQDWASQRRGSNVSCNFNRWLCLFRHLKMFRRIARPLSLAFPRGWPCCYHVLPYASRARGQWGHSDVQLDTISTAGETWGAKPFDKVNFMLMFECSDVIILKHGQIQIKFSVFCWFANLGVPRQILNMACNREILHGPAGNMVVHKAKLHWIKVWCAPFTGRLPPSTCLHGAARGPHNTAIP